MKIEYTKINNEISNHEIIPTNIPEDYISAIDVTHLNEDEISELTSNRSQYNQYLDLRKMKQLTFDEWLEHSNIKYDIKYRRFKLHQIKYL